MESAVTDDEKERLAYNSRIDALREEEYPMLGDQIYLDHSGTTIPSASLVSAFAADLTKNIYGNPHSFASASAQGTSSRVDHVRLKVLKLFNADPDIYDVVFVANATSGIKLVAEAFALEQAGFEYWYHRDSHTSIIGLRELARKSTCLEDDRMVERLLAELKIKKEQEGTQQHRRLLAYPAQSNMDGRRLPLSWTRRARDSASRLYTLLDVAAYVSTSPLNLGCDDLTPDFLVVSFYKMFGFPDLGALLVRKDAGHVFQSRKYFGGGTVETVACSADQQWHLRKMAFIHDGLEDGTLPIHNIVALDLAIDNHVKLFNSFESIAKHTSFLASIMHTRLTNLRHGNGSLVCEMYSSRLKSRHNGPVITFNLRDSSGHFVSHQEFHKLANVSNVHVRTGNLCNPGGVSRVLNMRPEDLLDNYNAGLRCGSDQDIIKGRPTGVTRISFGAMSTLQDVEDFIAFIMEFFVEDVRINPNPSISINPPGQQTYYVKSLTVYPIKSCGGYSISHNTHWPVYAQGLAWDREWCLIHQGTRKPLSQKRYPKLALFKPGLDFQQDLLKVTWTGLPSSEIPSSLSIPLSMDTASDSGEQFSTMKVCPTNLCGNDIEPLVYHSKGVTDFFSSHLSVPVYLARLPRPVLPQALDRQRVGLSIDRPMQYEQDMPGSFPTPPASPSGSESEVSDAPNASLSLANESPILVLFQPSLRQVNSLLPSGMQHIPKETFRANIVVDSVLPDHYYRKTSTTSYFPLKLPEDDLSMLEFGQSMRSSGKPGMRLKLLAPCRRCQMITLDQSTGQRRAEVFTHLAKVRRWNGGVWFGVHASWDSSCKAEMQGAKNTIKLGDIVVGR